MRIYFDTSFLVSLYSPDANWAAASRTMQTSKGEFLLTSLGELEVLNAFELRIFRKEVSNREGSGSLKDFERDLRDGIFTIRGFEDIFFARALQLSRQTSAKLGTRTADLLHVAAALELGVNRFYSFDRQQRKLAQSLRLKLN